MRTAVIVVDMLEETCGRGASFPITPHARAIIPRLQGALNEARTRAMPVIFACDSFLPQDFIFRGRMRPHSIRGTAGARVVADLAIGPDDHVLPKRRFSAFFKTDLDQTLRTLGCTRVAVAGITTNVCVLSTVLDALAHDFEAVWLTDCCAAHSDEAHEATLELYRKFPLEPLLRLQTAQELLAETTRT